MVVEVKPINAEANLRLNRRLHKVWLGFLKVIPMLLAGLYLLNTVLSYFNIDYSVISYVASIGVIPIIFLFISSYLLHFCEYHRMFLYYIIVNDVVCWADYTFTLPIDNWDYLVLHFIIAGVFLFIILWLRFKVCK